MNKTIFVSGIIVLFVLSTITPISIGYNVKISKSINEGNILYVGGNGPGNYTKIQDAIDNSSDGDTVFVYDDSSPYYEKVVINKTINLIGEDINTTVIDGSMAGTDYVWSQADWVNISGFTIKGGGITIGSDNNTIIGNKISYNRIGIHVYYSDNTIITDNYFIMNWEFSIFLYGSYNASVTNNNIISYGLGSNSYGIVINCLSDWNTIKNNNISENEYGIFISEQCNNNTIIFNNLSNNGNGIILGLHASNNIIKDNRFLNNSYVSILIRGSNNFIFRNNIINTRNYGIHIYCSCNNTIKNNNILNNDFGIVIELSSNNNYIFHNNLLNNIHNAIALDECNNTWDDGKYGNYWSDYKEKYPDAKPKLFKPWMWNTPYGIEGGNSKDNCPLIKEWPKTFSKTIPRDKSTSSPLFMRFLEPFPLLNLLIQRLRI